MSKIEIETGSNFLAVTQNTISVIIKIQVFFAVVAMLLFSLVIKEKSRINWQLFFFGLFLTVMQRNISFEGGIKD